MEIQQSELVLNEKMLMFPFEDNLTTDDLNLIKEYSNSVYYERRDIIFKQNTRTSHILYVKSGLIKIFKEIHNNRNCILRLAVKGSFLSLSSVLGSDTYQYSASAIEPTEVYYTDISVFNRILATNAKYASNLIRLISEDSLFVFDKLISRTHKQLPGRLADIILYFYERFYNNVSFEFPLTRVELAELAGTTKESLIRTLTEFKNDRIIDLEGKSIKINSIDIIRTLSKLG